ncbi:MAG TPA: circadian clock protein KaiC [Acidimicrobiales bacterium]|nr:circadian clock protein KaiC [Acidimicrobiales bacterium]
MPETVPAPLAHAPSGIAGFDAVTNGGLPRGRTTLVAGGPGCGKTLFLLETLIHGIEQGEPAVLVTFEETSEELAANVASLGWDLDALIASRSLVIEHVDVGAEPLGTSGDYDLEALLIRLRLAVEEVGARRVGIDTLEVLISSLGGDARLRAELRRLFGWLRARDLTTVVTAERGDGAALTRNGLEEYVADCVVTLDHRVLDQLAVRRLRVVKMRGSGHGTNEYPFTIGERGFSVVPVESFGLTHRVTSEVVPTGVAGLDAMIGRSGWYRGSTTMISGASGSGKTSFAAAFVDAACARGERALYLAFEESAAQLVRNMASLGIGLQRWIDAGLLVVHSSRPTQASLERHLTLIYERVEAHDPAVVVADPITDFTGIGATGDVKALLMRIVDYLKGRHATTLFTSLEDRRDSEEQAVSSLIDNFVHLRNVERDRLRSRALFIQKARGMSHSHEVRGFRLGDDGIHILPPGAE